MWSIAIGLASISLWVAVVAASVAAYDNAPRCAVALACVYDVIAR